jgi:anti-sigma factor RsiW
MSPTPLTHNELIYLMAYVDGQVDADELPEVEELLARSEEAQQIVAQHRAMGDWVRESSEEKAVAGGADAIADVVLHEIDKLGGGKVISLERERARLALNRQRVKEFGALGAVAAVAAALWLVPTRSSPVAVAPPVAPVAPVVQAPIPSAVSPAPSAVPSAMAVTEPSESDPVGVDVQSVESPSHPFSIFYVPAATGVNAQASSVVVWIAE